MVAMDGGRTQAYSGILKRVTGQLVTCKSNKEKTYNKSYSETNTTWAT